MDKGSPIERIAGQVCVVNEDGNMLFHAHDENGKWFDYQQDKFLEPCRWCEQDVPLVTGVYRARHDGPCQNCGRESIRTTYIGAQV